MTTLAEVRDGLEARLATIAGLRVYDYIPDDAHYPAAIILPPVIPDYREDLGTGSVRAIFPILLLVPRTIDRMQLDLYPYIDRTGPKSIFALVEADPTLGGLDVSALPIGVDDFDTQQVGLTNLYGRTVNINVFVS
ncbi:MAG: hypothetical protein ACREF4_10570 [Gammaproteobacteria bacterium]